MRDGRPHRRQGMAAVDQRIVFFALAQLIHHAELRGDRRYLNPIDPVGVLSCMR
jgi:hypothetical protein